MPSPTFNSPFIRPESKQLKQPGVGTTIQAPESNLFFGLSVRDKWWNPEPVRKNDRIESGSTQEVENIKLLDGTKVAYIRTYKLSLHTGIGKKQFYLRTQDGQLAFASDLPAEMWPLYGSEQLDNQQEPVIVTEGMSAAKALKSIGKVAVGTLGGATQPVPAEALRPLVDKDVVLWPDNDQMGVYHMVRLAASLSPITRSVRILKWKNGPHHGDAFDYVATNPSPEDIEKLLTTAELFDPELLINTKENPVLRPAASPLFLRSKRQMNFESDRWL